MRFLRKRFAWLGALLVLFVASLTVVSKTGAADVVSGPVMLIDFDLSTAIIVGQPSGSEIAESYAIVDSTDFDVYPPDPFTPVIMDAPCTRVTRQWNRTVRRLDGLGDDEDIPAHAFDEADALRGKPPKAREKLREKLERRLRRLVKRAADHSCAFRITRMVDGDGPHDIMAINALPEFGEQCGDSDTCCAAHCCE